MIALKLDGKTVKKVRIPPREIPRMMLGGCYIVFESDDVCMIAGRDAEQQGASQNALASLIARRQVYGDALIFGLRVNANGMNCMTDVPDTYVSALLK